MKEQERKKLAVAKARAKEAAEKAKAEKLAKSSGGVKSRYGHRVNSQSGKLDELFFKGATIKAAAKVIGSTETRVKSHIHHLKKNCGVTIQESKKGGTFKVK
jgi:hypothetical protein